ncbi:hypothetical protein [Geobacter sulfurreducens]|uniref:hypothetical protein n=1 Tax=Geobacter sulfurreducens TaxID=35554 RepID=UPI0020B6A621|nr:hypothetical protein [Geobacter sulfurreducens]UTG91796.1 hypothetical protein J8622_12255 [Geobacter sulfurreducens]
MPQYYFDADELLKDEVVLTKLDVGRRQIDSAIRMFFSEEDVVALHSVAAAAHGVLRDLARHQGITKSVKDSPLIADTARSEFLRAVNYPQNFFKHADSDPNGKMAFRHNGTAFFVLDAIVLYVALDKPLTHEMVIFLMWAQLRFPDLICYQPAEEHLAQIRDTTADPSAFKTLGRVLLSEQKKAFPNTPLEPFS